MIASSDRQASSTSPTPTATPSRSSTREATRWSKPSPAGRRRACPSAAAPTPWPSAPTAARSTSPTAPTTASPSSRLGREGVRGGGRTSRGAPLAGLIPTGWYPGARAARRADGKKLFVANVKGARRPERSRGRSAKGKNSHDHLGSVSIIDVPDAGQLAKYTEEVNANNRLAYSLAGLEKPRPDAKPVPVPRAARRAVALQARHLRHQGEPHLRPGPRRHEGGQRRPEPVHVRRGGDAQPPRPGPPVHAVRQLLLQRRPQRRRPPVGQRGLRHRLPGEGVRRLHAQLSRTTATTRWPSPPAASCGTTPWPTRRPSATTASSPRTTYARRARPGPTSTPTTRTAPRKVKIDVKPNVEALAAVHASRLSRLPADRRRTSTGPSSSSRS